MIVERLRSPGWRRLGTWLFGAYFVWFAVFFVYDFTVEQRKAEEMQPLVRQEFERVPPFPLGSMIRSGGTTAPRKVSVNGYYQTTAAPEEVRAYYDATLESLGWRILSERPAGPYETVAYCKGELRTALEYTRDRVGGGTSFDLWLSWGALANSCYREPVGTARSFIQVVVLSNVALVFAWVGVTAVLVPDVAADMARRRSLPEGIRRSMPGWVVGALAQMAEWQNRQLESRWYKIQARVIGVMLILVFLPLIVAMALGLLGVGR